MRKLIAILSFGLIYSCVSKHTDNASRLPKLEFKNIDSLNSLAILFDNAIIKDNQIVWPLDYEDIYSFSNSLSSDSLCHTTIDTILVSSHKYYVILRTDQYEKNIKVDCHVCSPIISIANFEKTQSGFKLINFKKNVFQLGGFGEYGTIKIDTLCIPVLKVSSGWTGTGAIISYDNYYDLNDFNFIYGLTTFNSNGGLYDEKEANYEETRKYIFSKTDSSFVLETIIVKNDSLNKTNFDKYFESVDFYNINGAIEIKNKHN